MILKPDFYDDFACIGGNCSFTCCMQWKIGVDDVTFKNWKLMNPPAFSKEAAKKDGFKKTAKLADYTRMKDGARVIRLLKNGYCPFLTEGKLCQIVLDRGEECISETCHVFPREVHNFENRTEYSLMSGCPEAVDFLNRIQRFCLNEKQDTNPGCVSLFNQRAWFIELIQNPAVSIETALNVIFFVALDNLKKSEGEACEEEKSLYTIPSEALLAEIIKSMEGIPSAPEESFYENNELFLDVICNYRKEGMYSRQLDAVSDLAEEISELNSGEEAVAEIPGSFEELFRKFLAAEIYADTLLPSFTAEDMVVKLQWICMEYAAIRHMCRLKAKIDGRLTYEGVRECIVVVSRMMGYEENDIVEYMENSFEDLIWEWGYFSLIVG